LPTGSKAKVGRVMVFKLGATGELPTVIDEDFVAPVLPELLDVSEEVIAKGSSAYANACVTCHGDQAFSSGLIPNLRYSAITKNADLWQKVIREGMFAERGMPNFGTILDAETTEAIRAFVISEANSVRDANFYNSVE
jgi:quinohemoprotein ethanol dehydrogenase